MQITRLVEELIEKDRGLRFSGSLGKSLFGKGMQDLLKTHETQERNDGYSREKQPR